VALAALIGVWVVLERPPEQRAGEVVLRLVVNSSERDQVLARLIRNGDPAHGYAGFEKTHPGIRLEFIKAAEGDKVGTMIAGGDAPDVVNVGAGQQFFYYHDANVMRDLSPYLTEADKRDLEGDFFPVAREAMMRDGKYYALPYNLVPFILIYNKRLFDRYDVPYPSKDWTWADYESAAKKLTIDKNHDGFPEIFGAAYARWQDGYYTWIHQNGGRILSDDGKTVTFDDPKVVETIAFLHKLSRKDGVMANQANQPKNVGAGLFADGRQAMIGPTGSFFIPQFRGEDYKNLDWDIAPTPKGPTGTRASVVAAGGYGVTTQSKHPKEAFQLVKYLCGPEGQALLAQSALFVPARRSVARDMTVMNPTGKPAHMQAVLDAVEEDYAFVPPWSGRRWGEVQDYLNQKLDDFIFGIPDAGSTAASVCRDISNKANEILLAERTEKAGTPLPIGPIEKAAAALAALILVAWTARVVIEARRHPRRAADQTTGYIAIAPWLIGFLVFAAEPILFSVLISLCRWNNLAPPSQARFIGLENYHILLSGQDDYFYKSLWVTAKYTLWAVPLGLVAGLILALFMNAKLKGIGWYRTLYYLPAVMPGIATTMLWWLMFKQQGILNYALGGWAGIDYHRLPDWLQDPNWTIPAIVLMGLWGVGGGMMIYLAGLQNIPTELYNAAEVDGAGPWSKFWTVTLPMLSPVLFFNLVMGIIGTFQVFGSALILFGSTGGPKQSALFYGLYMYHKAFEQFDIGLGSALAWVLFVIILVFTLMVFKSAPLWVYYEGSKEGKG
jgi:multiple sugar transport system permease protein